MTVKEVVVFAADLLGIGDSARAFLDGSSEEGENEVATLVRAVNLVENELAIEYFPLYCEEVLEVESGRLYYRDLANAVVRILSVKSQNGEKISYKIFSDYMRVDNGSVIVKYAYMPTIKTIEDTLDFGFGVSIQMLALGVVAEYCFMNGLYGEAEGWNKKYRAEIATSYRARPAKSIKERRWA